MDACFLHSASLMYAHDVIACNDVLLQALREELEHAQPDMDTVHEGGEELVQLVGEPDKPEVEKSVEEADSTWADVNSRCTTRQQVLDDALRKATNFNDELLVGEYSAVCTIQ